MSASGSCRTSCTRSLYEDLLCKVSVSRSPQLDYLCRISVCGSLVQDLSGMMSASGSSRTSCARSLYGDLLCKISLSGCLHQDSVGPLVQDLCMKSEVATLPAFRAMDTHDLRRGLHFEIRNRNFTCIPRTWHARSPQRVAIRNRNFTCIPRTWHARSPQKVALWNQKTQFHLHSAHSTRTISAEGSHLISKPCFRSTTPATKSWVEVIRNAALATQTHPQAQVPKMQPLSGIEPFDLKI